MPKLRHIAITTPDVEKTAKFYIEVFGMKEVGKSNDPGTTGCFLTDGELNLAVLTFKNDQAAGVERGKDFFGIHHFGFEVEDLAAISERLTAAGSRRRHDLELARRGRGRAQAQRRGEVHRAGRRHDRCLRDGLAAMIQLVSLSARRA